MTDKESYVNVADLKRKLRAFAKYRQYSKSATDELLGVVSKLKISIKADLETTLESADVQSVRHGRWECVGHDDKTYWYRCSVCGHEEHDNMTKHDNYCGSCGARMDGDSE